jgi:hypothetical protein
MLQAIQKAMLCIGQSQDRAEKLNRAEAEVREFKLKFSTAHDEAEGYKKKAHEVARRAESLDHLLVEEKKRTAELAAELVALKAKHAEEMAEEKNKARQLGMDEAAEDFLNNQLPEMQEEFLAVGWKAALKACNVPADSTLFKEIPHSSDLGEEEEPIPEAELTVEDYDEAGIGAGSASGKGRVPEDNFAEEGQILEDVADIV